MTEFNIMSVREIIDNSFGDSDTNNVNFKLIQAVLYIFARHLQVLQRHVGIQMAPRRIPKTSISLTELKIHSKSKKKEPRLDKKTPPKTMTDKFTKQISTQISSDKKPSTGMAVYERTSSEKSSTEKSSTEKSSTEKSSTEKSSTEKSSTEKSSTAKSSTNKSSTDQSSTQESFSKKSTTEKTATEKSDKVGGTVKGRRGEARGSDEDEDEILHEKLLVVSRTPSRVKTDDYRHGAGAEKLTVATQEQYKAIVAAIRELQTLFNQKDMTDIQGIGNKKEQQPAIRVDLQKRTSMTDPMAAVNMSTRLEAAEKRLAEIMPIATKLAEKTPGIDLESVFDDTILKQRDISEWGPPGLSSQTPPPITKSAAFEQPPPRPRQERQKPYAVSLDLSDEESEEEEESEYIEPHLVETQVELDDQVAKVTHEELKICMKEMSDAVLQKIKGVSSSCSNNCDASYKQLIKLDAKLEEGLKLGGRFILLEFAVEKYADEINSLDRKLNAQMTQYQDALSQMQYDLEAALDFLAEVLASPSEDAAAIAELNGHLTCFQLDVINTAQRQKELKRMQSAHAVNLSHLMKEIEKLQVTKCTREEVADALSNKAGIDTLNGMVALQQFDAVSGDFEKRIGASYDQFNNKEIVWQKAIDDLIRAINEKADYVQIVTLNHEIQNYIDMLRNSLDEMLNQVGELDSNPTTKKLECFDNCLSCGTRANIEMDEDLFRDISCRPPVIGTPSVKENTIHAICVPGQPTPHPRSMLCQRYCGVSAASHVDRQSSFSVPTFKLKPAQSSIV